MTSDQKDQKNLPYSPFKENSSQESFTGFFTGVSKFPFHGSESSIPPRPFTPAPQLAAQLESHHFSTSNLLASSPLPHGLPHSNHFYNHSHHACYSSDLQIPKVEVESTGYIPDCPNIPAAQYIDMQIAKQRSNAKEIFITRPLKDYHAKPSTQDLFRLSDFEFCNTLGTGTFGRVHLARLRNSGRFFAIKVVKKQEIIRMVQLEHIYCEKHLLSQLRNPFIISLYATFQDQTNLFMLMEYAIGGELFSYLRKAGKFCFTTTRFFVAEIVLALEYLHSHDIVYRDLKPENILLDAKGHIKLTDFGFSKVLHGFPTFTLCGTPEYLAPEIILGKGHSKPVDWWALGILTFEMLAGYPPFYDENNYAIYEKILKGIYSFPPYVDAVSRDFIRGLLLADVSKRLGNLSSGTVQIKSHPFFYGLDWEALKGKQVQPPIVPAFRHPGDTGNFERYPEEPINLNYSLENDRYAKLFEYF